MEIGAKVKKNKKLSEIKPFSMSTVHFLQMPKKAATTTGCSLLESFLCNSSGDKIEKSYLLIWCEIFCQVSTKEKEIGWWK